MQGKDLVRNEEGECSGQVETERDCMSGQHTGVDVVLCVSFVKESFDAVDAYDKNRAGDDLTNANRVPREHHEE